MLTMSPRARKLALTVHVSSSVGWLGAVVTFLVLAVLGVLSEDAGLVRAIDLIARPLVWWVLVPLSVASLLTGVIESIGTAWGLLRHYWVVFKLLLNIVATTILLLYTRTVEHYAELAERPEVPLEALRAPTFVVHAAAAAVILLAATVLAIYKPRGLIPRRSVAAGR